MKPITVAYMECKEKIVGAINESGLPAFAVIAILKEVSEPLTQLAQMQYENDLKKMEEGGEDDG